MNANCAEICWVTYFGGRFSTSSTCSIFLKFSKYICETSIIQIQQRKLKNIFLAKNSKKSLYYKNCIGHCGDKFNFRVPIWEQNTETEKRNGFWYVIRKTHLYNVDSLQPHFYIVKLGFTGVDIIFLISALRHCGYSLELPQWSSSDEYPQSMFWAEIWKILEFLSEIFHFLVVKSSVYLNRLVFLMYGISEQNSFI